MLAHEYTLTEIKRKLHTLSKYFFKKSSGAVFSPLYCPKGSHWGDVVGNPYISPAAILKNLAG